MPHDKFRITGESVYFNGDLVATTNKNATVGNIQTFILQIEGVQIDPSCKECERLARDLDEKIWELSDSDDRLKYAEEELNKIKKGTKK